MIKNTLLVALAVAAPLNAATVIHYNVNHTLVNPRYSSAEEITFYITFDESQITGAGDETLTSTHASFNLKFDGKDYSPTDDSAYPTFPVFTFTDGTPTGVSFATALKSDSAEADSYFQIDQFTITYGFTANEESIAQIVVPEPTSSALVLTSAFIFAFKRRR